MTPVRPIYIRASHVQAVFGFHRSTLYRWVNDGHITLHKVGNASFVRVDEVMNFIEGLKGQTEGQTGGQSANSTD